jgi:ADP-heptose:LPS heptosyltransferase
MISLFKLKKIIIKNKFFREIDFFIRVIFSFFLELKFLFSYKEKITQESNNIFLFILHGGMGDIVLILNLIDSAAKKNKVKIIIDESHKYITELTKNNYNIEIIIIDKKNIIKSLKEIKNKNEDLSKYILIQTSPVLEIYFIKWVLGINYSAGLKYSFNMLYTFKGERIRLNKINKNEIYTRMIEILFGITSNIKNNEERNNKKNGIIIAPNKNKEFNNIEIDSKLFVELIQYLLNKGHTVTLIGTDNDIENNNKISKYFLNSENYNDFTGRTTIAQLVDLIKKNSLLISLEGGVAHLASHLDEINVYVLYTFSDPDVYKWGSGNYYYYFNKKYACMPCIKFQKYPLDNYSIICNYQYRCKKSISTDTIIKDLEIKELI